MIDMLLAPRNARKIMDLAIELLNTNHGKISWYIDERRSFKTEEKIPLSGFSAVELRERQAS